MSVSALLFDYVLTGPISGVSARAVSGWPDRRDICDISGPTSSAPGNGFAAVASHLVVTVFWRKNIIGIHESSEKALRIMQITTVMVVILIIWCGVTIYISGQLPRYPPPAK